MQTRGGEIVLPRLKRRKDGRIPKTFTVTDENGNKKRKTIYGRTQKDAEEKYFEAIQEEKRKQKAREEPGSVITVSEWANTWLVDYKANLAYNTRKMYELNVNTYINPAIGQFPLLEVKHEHIQNLLNAYIAKDKDRTAQTIYLTVKQIFESARKRKYILVNPTLDIDMPEYEKPEKRALTDEEVEIINNAPLTLKEKAFIFLLLYTGLRRGEALALILNDIDMRNGYIYVRNNLYFMKNKPALKLPKTKAGKRKIPILDELRPVLAEYILSLNGDILFPSCRGTLMSQSAFKRFWKKISVKLADAGATAKDITPHIFRHTFTSFLVKNNVNIKDAQYVLGHSSAIITMDWYAHFDPKAPDNIKKRLNKHVFKLIRQTAHFDLKAD